MNILSRIATKHAIALNIIGKYPYNQHAIYDITEFLYIYNKPYVLTYEEKQFKYECMRCDLIKNTENIILNSMNVANYDQLADINQYTNDMNRRLWNVLIFPTPRDRANRIYTCNGIYIVEYYLSDKYDDKKRFVKFLIK